MNIIINGTQSDMRTLGRVETFVHRRRFVGALNVQPMLQTEPGALAVVFLHQVVFAGRRDVVRQPLFEQ